MNFRQILVQDNPVDCKNKLNDLLAVVERNFGVFSPDMELDIRTIISKDEVRKYFDRIIHEAYPVLEYDIIKKDIKSPPKEIKEKNYTLKKELTPKQNRKQKRKEKIKQAKKEKAIQQDRAIRSAERQRRLSEQNNVPDYALKRLAINGRDYSKPSLESQIQRSRSVDGKEKPSQWVSIISIPMGGLNKKH